MKIADFSNKFFAKKIETAAVQKYANLELEKCCQTHIFLQNFVLIQPRTSPPKFLQPNTWIHGVDPWRGFFGPIPGSTGARTGRARRRGPRRRRRRAAPRRRRRAGTPAAGHQRRDLGKFRQNVARFWLYRHRFLQENMRFAAFFKIYQII